MAATLTSKPLDFFKPHPGNPRTSSGTQGLQELHDSLVKKQLVPLLAKPDGTILDGYRRWLAANLDGKPERLDVVITDEILNPAQVKETQLVTALHRADLTPYEQFVGMTDWMALNHGAPFKDLGTRIDRDSSMVMRILSLARCIRPVQEAAAEGKVGVSEWYAIAKVPEFEQPAMLAATLNGVNRDQLERRGRKLRNGDALGIKVNRLRIPLGSQGRSVTIAGRDLSLDDAIETLQEALKHARKAQGENLDGKTWVQVMKSKAKPRS
jgi:ParB/RepB/Spo0J family partition protein